MSRTDLPVSASGKTSTAARRYLRYALVLVIAVVCTAVTVRLFDWHAVWHSIQHMRFGFLLGTGVPILFSIFMMRGLRWLIVLGIRPTFGGFWQSFCANGAALGLASVTPFLLGEVIKIRLIPDHHGKAWRVGASGFLVERAMDVSGVVGMGLSGLALQYGFTWPALLGPLLPVLAGLVLCLLSNHVHRLPRGVQPYLESFRYASRLLFTSLLTIPIWLLYTALFWTAAQAMNVTLDLGQVTVLLGGITLAVAATMVPGGMGVSELGTRGIMLWTGASVQDAEATAVALRLLTPLIFFAGIICVLALATRRGRQTGE